MSLTVWRESLEAFPAEVRLMILASDVGSAAFGDRRQRPRSPYRFQTALLLIDEPPETPPHLVFTRDVNEWGIGFLTPDPLPVAREGRIELPLHEDAARSVDCTIIRCRPFLDGWYEGAALFEQEQPDFAAERIDRHRQERIQPECSYFLG